MFRVEIDSMCRGPLAPSFSNFDDAKRCFYAACDFLLSQERSDQEVWLTDDDGNVYMWCIPTPDGIQKSFA